MQVQGVRGVPVHGGDHHRPPAGGELPRWATSPAPSTAYRESRLGGEVPDPGAEVRVAGIGPLVSLVLGGVFLLVAWLLHGLGVRGVVVAALAWLGGINIVLAVFNVIPAAPLDGGR